VIWQLLQWLLLIGLVLYIGSVLWGLLPFVLLGVAVTIAVCCVYALLPDAFRLPMLEIWLDPDWQPPTPEPSPRSPPSFSPSNSPNSFTSPNSPPNNYAASTTRYNQPSLDFENITTPIRGQIPNREEFIASLKSQVIGQDKAIEMLVRAVLGKLAAQNYNKPLVIFLGGSTGTGKTELCKALAITVNVKLNRFDMGECADSFKASNLMGSAKGYVGAEDGGDLPNALRHSKKRCVLVFDEVEKAHPSIWRQLLAFFDEGRITDTLGTVIAPKHTICLLTSNLAADKIASNPEAAKDIVKDTGFFSPEFIGRVDKFIPLPRLNEADLARLTVVLAKRVATRYGINLVIEQEVLPELVQEISEEGDKYGGRGIQEKILDLLGDDFIDLQTTGTTQARLLVIEGVLKAVGFE
jgi:ATP-dependent Clp protease ATP-binding subunit ClpA